MPARTPSHLPKYRHYKPKDLAAVRLDGKDHYLGKYNSEESREKYRRVVAEWWPLAVRTSRARTPAGTGAGDSPSTSRSWRMPGSPTDTTSRMDVRPRPAHRCGRSGLG